MINGNMVFEEDWDETLTEAGFLAEFHIPLVGEGWYYTNMDTLFVARLERGRTRRPDETLYRCYVWNRPSIGKAPDNVALMFKEIADAPVRHDTRGQS